MGFNWVHQCINRRTPCFFVCLLHACDYIMNPPRASLPSRLIYWPPAELPQFTRIRHTYANLHTLTIPDLRMIVPFPYKVKHHIAGSTRLWDLCKREYQCWVFNFLKYYIDVFILGENSTSDICDLTVVQGCQIPATP